MLVVDSVLLPVVLAWARPLLGATVGLAAPLPVWLRPSRSRGGAETSATRSLAARLAETLNLLALALENELWESKRLFCAPTITCLEWDPDLTTSFLEELQARATSALLPGTPALRSGRLRAATEPPETLAG